MLVCGFGPEIGASTIGLPILIACCTMVNLAFHPTKGPFRMKRSASDFLRPVSLAAFVAALAMGCSSAPKPVGDEAGVAPEKVGGVAEPTLSYTPKEGAKEIRGIWITNVDSDVLMSRESIAEAMQFLHERGINVIYPVVWNKALTMYPSEVMSKTFGTPIDPVYGDRDPLQEVIIEAHLRGMEVIPWFEFGFATSFKSNGGTIIQKFPQWAALDREGKLATKNGFEWMNAFDPEVQAFLESLVLEVARKYDVDGIQGDDRMPANPSLAGYDEKTKARYFRETGKQVPQDEKDAHWVQWRSDILTDWLAGLRTKVKAIDKDLIISMSPSYYSWSKEEYLQDSKTWTEKGLADTLHPQAYRYDFEAYKKVITDIVKNQFTPEQLPTLAPGLLIKSGKYRIPNAYFLDAIAFNRSMGVNGEVHFFYTGLRLNNNELGNLLGDGPYRYPAALPYRSEVWRPVAIDPGTITINGAAETLKETRTVTAGDKVELTFTIAEPGVYSVLMELPAKSSEFGGALRGSIPPTQPNVSVNPGIRVDLAETNSGGWRSVGKLKRSGVNGTGPGDIRMVWEVSEAPPGGTRATIGPVKLLLNRKATNEMKKDAE